MALQPFTGKLDAAPAAPALQPFTGQLDAPADGGPGYLASLGAGLGKGVGDVALNAQNYLGKGLSAVGADRAGQWLQDDARAGHARLAAENAPFAQAHSTTNATGEIAGPIVATLPVGGILGAGAKAAGAVPLGEALASGGLSAAGGGLATRVAGGAITGGASAALADPDAGGVGAVLGGGIPVAGKLLGAAGQGIGRAVRGTDVPEGITQAAQAAQAAGYVIPPTQVKPSLINSLLEGVGGKIKTAQNASAANQEVTTGLAKQALGVKATDQLSPDLLTTIRRQAGAAYDSVANTGTITPGARYSKALDDIVAPYNKASQGFPGAAPNPIIADIDALRSTQFDAGSAVAKIRELRGMADAAYRRGEKDIGKAYKDGAGALEGAIEDHLTTIGAPASAISDFRNARQLIAKTYTVEKALNPTTGSVSARDLAGQLKRGKPLSGELRQAAEFAQAFPKAAQVTEQVGSRPLTSPLDWALAGGVSAAGATPLAAVGLAARPLARAAALSGPIQRGLARAPTPSPALRLNQASGAAALLGRAAPVGLSNRDQ